MNIRQKLKFFDIDYNKIIKNDECGCSIVDRMVLAYALDKCDEFKQYYYEHVEDMYNENYSSCIPYIGFILYGTKYHEPYKELLFKCHYSERVLHCKDCYKFLKDCVSKYYNSLMETE